MNWKSFLLAMLALDFMGVTVWAVWSHGGLVQTFAALAQTPAGILAMTDLGIVFSAVMVWMFFDAKERGYSPWGWMASVMATGSAGLLAYLARRQAA